VTALTQDPSLSAQVIQGRATEALAKVCVSRGAAACVDLASEVAALWDDLSAPEAPSPGRATGLRDLDGVLGGGLLEEQLVIIAARPAMGQSALALQAAAAMARRSGRVALFFSLEMPRRELLLRLISAEADVDSEDIRTRSIDEESWNRVSNAGAALARVPLVINDAKDVSLADIRAIALQERARRGALECVVVDYIQLVSSSGGRRNDTREQQVSEISRGLKVLAGVLECPVIALSQLSRKVEERSDKRPMLSDLRESGAIEQDADIVLFVYRDEMYDKNTEAKGIAELIVAKQRNGPTKTARTRFRADRTTFSDLSESEVAEAESAPRRPTGERRRRRRGSAARNEFITEDDSDA
jgi:replicative DNA helicase